MTDQRGCIGFYPVDDDHECLRCDHEDTDEYCGFFHQTCNEKKEVEDVNG